MKDTLIYILKGIVKDPENVSVKEYSENNNKVFEIKASEDDVGQIIGKDGRTIKSINILYLSALYGFIVRYQCPIGKDFRCFGRF